MFTNKGTGSQWGESQLNSFISIGATLPAYTGTAMIVIEFLISIGLLFSSVVRSISILLPIPILSPMARAIFADVCVGEKNMM